MNSIRFCDCPDPPERLAWVRNKTTGRLHCCNCSGAIRPDQEEANVAS